MVAHDGLVTAIAWQPLGADPSDEKRFLASGGEDGVISIWNARVADNKPKYTMTMDYPIAALAFTQDGAFLAGATAEKIHIWKVGDYAVPRAVWSRMPHPGWLSPRINGFSDDEDAHCMGWDATGQKLAYGANRRVCPLEVRFSPDRLMR